MENIVTEIAGEFIKEIIALITGSGKGFTEIEETALAESKKCAARLISVYAETVDARLAADKSGRRAMGYTVQRRGDERRLQSLVGEVTYQRTYYKKAAGGYEYLTDTVLGIERRERVSKGMSLALATAAKDMSYGKSSIYVSGGGISRQTVMERVRRSGVPVKETRAKLCVPELHIDADEAHITLCGGRKSIVPLISVYEGIDLQGKRHRCKNIFHISEYGKPPDELWEQALTEIEQRYDLTDTKVYIHGDGGAWVQTGFEWIPKAKFVLDKYHKNRAIKAMTANLPGSDVKTYEKEIRRALNNEELLYFGELTNSIIGGMPEREDKIRGSAAYLERFCKGISICNTDPSANNGGCTEPHVSHVLSSRLSSRPMAWSKKTLKRLAPVLASGKLVLHTKEEPMALPKPLLKAAASASKALSRGAAGLPLPESIGRIPVNGKITGTQVILKTFA